MTKKVFKELAAIATIADPDERHGIARLIGKVCTAYNPRFDWDKWLAACKCASQVGIAEMI